LSRLVLLFFEEDAKLVLEDSTEFKRWRNVARRVSFGPYVKRKEQKMGQKTWEDEFIIVKETDKAILIEYTDSVVWIPLSQIEAIHRDPQKGTARVVMSEWIAKQKGFI